MYLNIQQNPSRIFQLSLILLLFTLLSGCTDGRRERDMDLFFKSHYLELSQLQDQLQKLQKSDGVRGINLEQEKITLVKSSSLSIDDALERFPNTSKQIKQLQQLGEKLEIRNSYLLEDGSFWVILDEADLLGSDYGYLHEGEKPVNSYRILNKVRAMPTASGWHLIRF
jgi:hypothetical protein